VARQSCLLMPRSIANIFIGALMFVPGFGTAAVGHPAEVFGRRGSGKDRRLPWSAPKLRRRPLPSIPTQMSLRWLVGPIDAQRIRADMFAAAVDLQFANFDSQVTLMLDNFASAQAKYADTMDSLLPPLPLPRQTYSWRQLTTAS
jgi:hypothetical protein